MSTVYFFINAVQAEIINGITDVLENETLPSIFTCQSTGQPIPTISWYFDDIMINVSDENKYILSTSINGTVVTSVLTIVSIQSSDVGTYTCFATNIIGGEQRSGVLTVNSM